MSQVITHSASRHIICERERQIATSTQTVVSIEGPVRRTPMVVVFVKPIVTAR